jgi:hypothetical protein
MTDFLCGMVVRNGRSASGLVSARFGQEQAMRQRLQTWRPGAWRSGEGPELWLSMLVAAMEEVSRPEIRKIPCDPKVLIALRAQLARPASPYPYGVSNYSLRN